MKNRTLDMTQGPFFKKIILYTLPIMATGLLQLLFNAADLVVVGRFCGSVSVGAVGATGSLINLLVNFFIGFSTGAGVTVAHGLGAKQDKLVQKTIHTAIPLAIVSALLLTGLGQLITRPMLELMGTPAENIDLSETYMRIYFCGALGSLLYNFGASILRAAGDTRGPLIYLTIAGVVNVVLNLIFVYFFHMNVAGVALATIISQMLSAVLVLRALMKRTDACNLNWRKLKFDMGAFKKIVNIGLPAGIQSSLFSISNVTIQSSINSFGSTALNGNAAASNIEGFVYTSINSFYQAALNFTGQNIGAGKEEQVKKVMAVCFSSVAVTGLVLGGLVNIFAEPLLSIYITDSAESIRWGMTRMLYVGIPYFICGLMDSATGFLRGSGASVSAMLITVIGVCGIRVGWIFTIFQIPEFHTLPCLLISYPISWALTFATEISVYFILANKRKKARLAALAAQS